MRLLNRREYAYAVRLCVALVEKHYPEVTEWKPLPDLLGVLTQIDNITVDLERKKDEQANSMR